MVKKQKNYPKAKNVIKVPKKLKIFSLKIHTGAGIQTTTINFLNKGTKHKKNYVEALNSKNKNIKGGGSPK